jgi:uncharacterized protein DUF6916
MDVSMTPITRRRLLQTGGMAAAGAMIGLPPRAARAAGAAGADSSTAAYLRRSGYTALSSASFTAMAAGGSTPLTLTQVSDLTPTLAGADDAFSLAFTGPVSAPLPQGTHTLSHPALGAFDLFVVPVDEPRSDQQYQVIVDRSVALGTAAAPVPPQGAPGAGGSVGPHAAAIANHPVASESLVRHVSARRAGRGVLCELVLAPGAQVSFVRAWLMRGRHVLGVAEHRVHGHGRRISFRVGTARRVPSGHFELVIATTDTHGVESMAPHPIVLR